MKKIVFLLMFAMGIGSLSAQNAKPVDIVVSGGKLSINKKKLSKWEVATVVSVLGTEATVSKKSSQVHVYDAEGISLYEEILNNQPDGNLNEIHIFFIPAQVKWETPAARAFSGKLSIDGVVITEQSGYAQLKGQLKDVSMNKGYKPHSYTFSKDGLVYYLDFNEAESKLARVSIGEPAK